LVCDPSLLCLLDGDEAAAASIVACMLCSLSLDGADFNYLSTKKRGIKYHIHMLAEMMPVSYTGDIQELK
jgi:hypothetical protein